jgi:hypothetical protein
MHTIPEIAPPRKPRAHYCTYQGIAGILTKPAERVLFLEPVSGTVVPLTPEEVFVHVVVTGEVSLASAQYLSDMARGGAATICCSRAQEAA